MDFSKVTSLRIPEGNVTKIEDKEGKVLWTNINKVAYGVRWDSVNWATTACERIGNLELHKTLPIQSRFKVCIHKGKEIQYYCHPDDSRFRQDNTGYVKTLPIVLLSETQPASIEATSATFTDKVKANGFLANYNGNGNTAWITNGGSINLLTLLSNAAIYVARGFEIAESGLNGSTVVDNPDSIIFDKSLLGGRFPARKGLTCYIHWKADISKNIAPPSRYGIETNNGVFPFNNQMYKFSNYDNIYIATCSKGTYSIKN